MASIHQQQTLKERDQGQNPIYKSLKLNRMPMNKLTREAKAYHGKPSKI